MADGSIVIDTKIDSKGIQTGAQVITKQIKSIGTAIVGAFGAATVGAFVKDAVESFSAMGSAYGMRIRMMEVSFMRLKGVIATIFDSLISAAAPYIIQAIQGLITMLTTLAQVTQAMLIVFLGTEAVTGSLKAAGDAQGRLTNQTERWAKAAKGALAGFDELKVLDQKPTIPGVTVPTGMLEQVQAFKDKLMAFLQPAIDAFNRLVAALTPLGETIWAGLKWAWDNIFVPLGNWVMNAAVPAFLDLVSAAAGTLNAILIALKPMGLWLWENFLQPLASWTGDLIIGALKELTKEFGILQGWITNNQTAFQVIAAVIGIVAAALFFFLTPIGSVILIMGILIGVIATLVHFWPQISQAASDAWAWVVQAWKDTSTWFKTNVIDPISKAWQDFWTWVGTDPVRKAFDSVFTWAKGGVNSVIDLINGMIRAITDGINAVIGGMNSLRITIPDWVPNFGGQTWGLNMGYVSAPQIPRLATGAVIPPNAQFAAILGDQSSGRNLEAPEGLIRQIIREEIGSIQADVRIEFGGSLGELARILRPYQVKENTRVGGNLIQGVLPT